MPERIKNRCLSRLQLAKPGPGSFCRRASCLGKTPPDAYSGFDGNLTRVSQVHQPTFMMRSMNIAAISDLNTLKLRIREFADARAWAPYHTPKNLAMALIVEAAELVEQFQWLTPEESVVLSDEKHEAVRQEIADVLIYLTRLADMLDIDLLAAAEAKIEINARKYPVEKARGNAVKYKAEPQ